MFTDCHCHLDHLDDPEDAIREAATARVTRIVAVSEATDSLDAVLDLASRFPDTVLPGVGLHPASFTGLSGDEARLALEGIEREISRASVVGEIGLDFKHADTDEKKRAQIDLLHRQLDLAAGAGIPVNLHSRWAERQTLLEAIEFTKKTGLGAVMHWFTRSKKLIRLAGEGGVYISAGPSIVGSEQAHQVVRLVPDHLVLLETDTPVPIQGRENRPCRLAEVAAELGRIKGWSQEEVSERTEGNFRDYLGR